MEKLAFWSIFYEQNADVAFAQATITLYCTNLSDVVCLKGFLPLRSTSWAAY